MKPSRILMLAVLALAVLGGSAHAQGETTFVHVNTVEIDSTTYNVYDMMVTSTYDWEASRLSVWLDTGEFYNDSVGSDTQPTAAAIALAPDLEWDTYAATPGGETTPASFTRRSQFGQNPGTAWPPMGNTAIQAGWYDTAHTAPGTFKAARLTLASHAAGWIDGGSGHSGPLPGEINWAWFEYVIEEGNIRPAPDWGCQFDPDYNGFVDDYDLAVLLSNWEQDPGTISTCELGDFTGDTDIDDDDLAVLLGNWTGPPPGGASVPGPATLALLALASLAAMRRRRRYELLCVISLVAVGAVSWAGPAEAAAYTWTPTAAGTYNWDDATSNWGSGFPNAIGDTARANINLAGDQTIDLNGAITIGALNIGDTGGTYYATSIRSGTAGSLTFDVASGSAVINKGTRCSAAKDIISATITLNDNINITNAATQASGALMISGDIGEGSAGMTLTKLGAGVLVLSGENTYTGATTVSAGTLLINSPGSLAADSAVTVYDAGTLGGTGTIGSAVTVQAGGTIAPGAPGASVGTLTGTDLTIADGGSMTIGIGDAGNDLIDLSGYLALPGAWTLNAFVDVSAIDPTGLSFDIIHYGTIDLLTNVTIKMFSIGYGYHVPGAALVADAGVVTLSGLPALMTMRPADANVDGYVDDDDLAVLLGNWEQDSCTITMWQFGDFTGDTDVDDDDLAVLLANWTGPPPGGACVPEPATLSLLALGALAVMRRRRRGSTGGER